MLQGVTCSSRAPRGKATCRLRVCQRASDGSGGLSCYMNTSNFGTTPHQSLTCLSNWRSSCSRCFLQGKKLLDCNILGASLKVPGWSTRKDRFVFFNYSRKTAFHGLTPRLASFLAASRACLARLSAPFTLVEAVSSTVLSLCATERTAVARDR